VGGGGGGGGGGGLFRVGTKCTFYTESRHRSISLVYAVGISDLIGLCRKSL